MSRKIFGLTTQLSACRLSICAFAWIGVVAAGCAGGDDDESLPPPATNDAAVAAADGGAGSVGSGGLGGTAGTQPPAEAGSGSMTGGGSGDAGMSAATDSSAGGGDAAPVRDAGPRVEPKCGASDTPEKGLQGNIGTGTVNCGLTLLSEIPFGGSVQASGHCAYVRTGSVIKAFSLADPLKPVQTDEVPTAGSSESMRAHTVEGRAILVSGRGVYDISNCEKLVKKGEIIWPSEGAQGAGLGTVAALSSHEISISHDAKRVYSGLGFNIAYIEDLEKPDTWTVKDWTCEVHKQTNFPTDPANCEGPRHKDVGRQYSHSSDDNFEGTVWYGANQEGSSSQMERSTARMIDISDRASIKILDTVALFPGHSMNYWKTPDGREYIIGANEAVFGAPDSCVQYPRPVNLGNALDAYVVEVTGKKFGKPFPLTLAINKPENCQMAKASRSAALITEHSVYNKGEAAFVMIEFGSAGLRVFDLRDGDNPKEAAYYNDGKGHTHSGVFHYEDTRGIMVASGRQAGHVLMLQPQMIEALGLPKPTDPKYPYK